MNKILHKLTACAGALLLMTIFSAHLQARGEDLTFYSGVSAIEQYAADEGIVTILVKGFTVPVFVNGDTEIMDAGSEISLGELSVGGMVKINAFFSDTGITAEEISIVQRADQHFRFKGQLTSVSPGVPWPEGLEFDNTPMASTSLAYTLVAIEGVNVYIDAETLITKRGEGFGGNLPANVLFAGDLVDIRGSYQGVLLAERIHVGTPEQGKIEVDGIVADLTMNGFNLDISGSGKVSVEINEDTDISGDLAAGGFVEVEGMLNQNLAITALEVVIDADGDGDADDDNHRGNKPNRGNHGHGNGSRWDNMAGAQKVGIALLMSADRSMHGMVKTHVNRNRQSFRLDIRNAEPETDYSVVAHIGNLSVALGSLQTNRAGNARLEVDGDSELDLVLPANSDLNDISGIEVLAHGQVVMTGRL